MPTRAGRRARECMASVVGTLASVRLPRTWVICVEIRWAPHVDATCFRAGVCTMAEVYARALSCKT